MWKMGERCGVRTETSASAVLGVSWSRKGPGEKGERGECGGGEGERSGVREESWQARREQAGCRQDEERMAKGQAEQRM